MTDVLLVLSAADVRSTLSMTAAIDSVRAGFAALARGEVSVPPRTGIDVHGGNRTLLMGAHLPGRGISAKVVSSFPGNRARGLPTITGLVVLLDEQTGRPIAVCDGSSLTAIRTGAASGVATDLLARTDSRVAAMIGCGVQAVTQCQAIQTVRRIEVIRVCGRSVASARRFCEQHRASIRARLEPELSVERAVRDADVICTATDATEPVLQGAWLAPGTHVNAVGSFTIAMRELDPGTVARSRVFVDAVAGAVEEAGDLLAAERAGSTSRRDWTEIGAVAAGLAPGRRTREEITVFKSVGHAVQDVAALAVAVARARELGLGCEVAL